MIPPSFLVIGAMKCATTTLYHDLLQNSFVTCSEKEEGLFLNANLDLPSNVVAGEAMRGEICTMYSMLPDVQGIPLRVAKFLGNRVKIVYLVRNPLRRTISHHQHFFNWKGKGSMGPDINQELALHPQLLQYSCYGMQIAPWIEQFGRNSIHVIRFEDYVSERTLALKGLCDFLGVPDKFGAINNSGENRGDSKRVAGASVLRLYQTNFFRKLVKPYTPAFLRTVARRLLLRKAKSTVIPPTPASVNQMLQVLAPDAELFAKLVGASNPLWDLAHTAKQLERN